MRALIEEYGRTIFQVVLVVLAVSLIVYVLVVLKVSTLNNETGILGTNIVGSSGSDLDINTTIKSLADEKPVLYVETIHVDLNDYNYSVYDSNGNKKSSSEITAVENLYKDKVKGAYENTNSITNPHSISVTSLKVSDLENVDVKYVGAYQIQFTVENAQHKTFSKIINVIVTPQE